MIWPYAALYMSLLFKSQQQTCPPSFGLTGLYNYLTNYNFCIYWYTVY